MSFLRSIVEDDLSGFKSGNGNGLVSADARPVLLDSMGEFVCDLLKLNTTQT